ncbi:hypothetical protein HF086_013349 [Spodoptera exigua]|uniref:Uncharacterized protein n=1 Tax=Spodoptera exigua TaxID=7107 RepID=A0A922S9L5_SPOEX|nr:hypothetical protein HF086_013349 [Spodoptera exigua]
MLPNDIKVCDKMEKRELFDSSYDDELYNQCVMVETTLIQQQVGRGIKQGIITNENKVTKKTKLNEGASTSSIETNDIDNNKVECDTCHVYIAKSSYVNLPQDIKLKKAVINVKNNDNMCFKWALLSGLYPVGKSVDRRKDLIAIDNMIALTFVRNYQTASIPKKDWFGKPTSNTKLKFDKFVKKLEMPFVIYADFEAFLNPIESCSNDPSKPSTVNIQKHEVYSFGYYIKCSYDNRLSKYETYSGSNCAQVFMNRLCEDVKTIVKKNSFQKCPVPLSDEDKIKISNSTICYICETELNEDLFTILIGTLAVLGVLHINHYDAHFIVHALNFDDNKVEVIPQNKERYISFSKQLTINNQPVSLRFVDSLKFLSCSLDQLAKNLNDDQFTELKRNYPNNEDFSRLRRKVKEICTCDFNQITWCFDEMQPLYNLPNVNYHQGIPNLNMFDGENPHLIIIDDLMRESDGRIVDIFTKGSHHRNLSVFYLTQNLFHQGKIPLKDQDKQKLNKHKNILRKLVHKCKHKLRKNIIIQKGGTFLPIILSAILSGLRSKSSVDAESLLEEKGSIKSIESEVNPLYSPTQILSLIPKTYNKKGESLLNLIGISKSKIRWDNEGTVIIDNEKIPGSNIVDLINDSLRPLKKSDPVGWDRFAKALKDIKVPLTYIGNPKRCEFINQLQAKDLNKTSEIEVQEFSTPSSGEKRSTTKIRKKIDWEKWTPY